MHHAIFFFFLGGGTPILGEQVFTAVISVADSGVRTPLQCYVTSNARTDRISSDVIYAIFDTVKCCNNARYSVHIIIY